MRTRIKTSSAKVYSYRYAFQGQEKVDEVSGKGSSYTAEFWQYDSRLGRRWNLDPKPNPAISPYATYANNPILYQDLLGDTIRVAGNKVQRIKTLLYLQTLTNDKLVLKGNRVIIDFKNSTNCNRNLDNGTGLVKDLINHEKSVTIYQTDGKNRNKGVAGVPKSDESNGVGKDQNVFINFRNFDYVLSESPIDGKSVNMLTPFRIALAHELIHAYYGMEGKDSPQDKKDSYIFKDVDDKMYRISQDKVETDTVGLTGKRKYTENKIRKEQGMTRRVKY